MEGSAIANLQNLRTEIILCDADNVAFWFSFSIRIATLKEQEIGKLGLPSSQQTQIRLKALFPKWPDFDEKIKSGEDDSNIRD